MEKFASVMGLPSIAIPGTALLLTSNDSAAAETGPANRTQNRFSKEIDAERPDSN